MKIPGLRILTLAALVCAAACMSAQGINRFDKTICHHRIWDVWCGRR